MDAKTLDAPKIDGRQMEAANMNAPEQMDEPKVDEPPLEAARPQLTAALCVGGIAALCAAPSLTSAVGEVGSLLQAQLNLLLPGGHQQLVLPGGQPETDMLLMKMLPGRSASLNGGMIRRSSKSRNSVASIGSSTDRTVMKEQSSTDGMPVKEKQRRPKRRTTKTGDRSRRNSKWGRELRRRHRNKRKGHRKREKGVHASAAAEATGTVAMFRRSRQDKNPQQDHTEYWGARWRDAEIQEEKRHIEAVQVVTERIQAVTEQAFHEVVQQIRAERPAWNLTSDIRERVVAGMPVFLEFMQNGDAEAAAQWISDTWLKVCNEEYHKAASLIDYEKVFQIQFDMEAVDRALNSVVKSEGLPGFAGVHARALELSGADA